MRKQVYEPVLDKTWNIHRFKGTSLAADESLDRINKRLKVVGRVAASEQKAREKYAAQQAA